MTCKDVIGNIETYPIGGKTKDVLDLEWYETTKRVMRKKTASGSEIIIQFLKEGNRLKEGDILYEDAEKVVLVNILPCDAIQVTPRSIYEMGVICYEIGNKHLPLFLQDDHVLIPYEKPLERLLKASGYQVTKAHTKLLNNLKAGAESHHHHDHDHGHDHHHDHGKPEESLFSKILDIEAKE